MTQRKISPAAGRSVWTATELRHSPEWVFRLPDAALCEIEAGLARTRGRPFSQVTAADFPLESIAGEIAAMRAEIADGRGFVVLRGLPVAPYSADDLKRLYWGIGAHFGTGTVQSFLGDLIGDIRDVSDEEPDPRKRRGYHSGGAQDVHTDSCDIVSMLSLRLARHGGESTLASAHTVHNIMLAAAPGLLAAFYDGFFLRTTDTDAAAAGRPALSERRVPAFSTATGTLTCSYVRGYVDRAVAAGDVALSPVEKAAVESFTAISNHPDVCLHMLLEPGDMQFVNNRTMLHGRAHFEDFAERERRRHLYRLWLRVPQWPRLPAAQDQHSDAVKRVWEANARAMEAAPGAAE